MMPKSFPCESPKSLKMVLFDLPFQGLGGLIQLSDKLLVSAHYVPCFTLGSGDAVGNKCVPCPLGGAQILKRQHQACRCQMSILAENESSKDETTRPVASVYVFECALMTSMRGVLILLQLLRAPVLCMYCISNTGVHTHSRRLTSKRHIIQKTH